MILAGWLAGQLAEVAPFACVLVCMAELLLQLGDGALGRMLCSFPSQC